MDLPARFGKYALLLFFALCVSVSLSTIYTSIYNAGTFDPAWDFTANIIFFAAFPFLIFYLMFLFGDKVLYWIGGILVTPFTVLALYWLSSSVPGLFTGDPFLFHAALLQTSIAGGSIVLGPLLGRLSRPLLHGSSGVWFGRALIFLGALIVVGGVYSATSLSLRPAPKPIIPQGIQVPVQGSINTPLDESTK